MITLGHRGAISRVAIVGVGLIGGSLGLALKKAYPRLRISGFDRPGVLKKAKARKAIDSGHTKLENAVADADLVILALPVDRIIDFIPRISRLISDDVIVTDVGSVKKDIVRMGRRHFPRGNFVGGHPVAGSEQAGVQASSADLFRNRPYVLTPYSRRQKPIVSNLSNFLAPLGARVSILTPEKHDQILAALSHLPQLSSIALMNAVGKKNSRSREHLDLSGPGLLDTTRMAESSFEIWKGILHQNRRNVVKALDIYLEELRKYRSAMDKSGNNLGKEFESARRLRSNLRKR